MLQIYCGNGKGKTTASVGLAVRAAGAGLKVMFCQFLKNGSSSEIGVLRTVENITAEACDECGKFTFQMNSAELESVRKSHSKLLENAFSGDADVIILDEFLDAYNIKLLDTGLADRLILNDNSCREIVLTGRDPSEKYTDKADYISYIKAVKHPYDNGITARKGIEY